MKIKSLVVAAPAYSLSTPAYNGTITLVPEAETYGMLLAGLGLMGAVVRRRNKADSDQA